MENKISILSRIKEIYNNGGNIIDFLKKISNQDKNSIEDILISYDFQAGSYIKFAEENSDFLNKYTYKISEDIKNLKTEIKSILEVGVGEATTLANLVNHLNFSDLKVYGLDISWSRILFGNRYLKDKNINNAKLFTADLFNIPLANNSIDIVYTSHSLEPNGGREEEALKELYRVTNKYLILLEPAYEFADNDSRLRMKEHGYVKNLVNIALNLGYKVNENRLFEFFSNKNNPTQIIVIEKNKNANSLIESNFNCPISKTKLSQQIDCFYSENGLLAYPIIRNIPCLLPSNAIVATHFHDFD